ncbi:hypothetical protein HQ48_05100 [Porphyromonas sp. COT-290 OH3588]|nr:hypothetical protein HQ48_05100 [Porphyromonas sp. COT-290 OH3588]
MRQATQQFVHYDTLPCSLFYCNVYIGYKWEPRLWRQGSVSKFDFGADPFKFKVYEDTQNAF